MVRRWLTWVTGIGMVEPEAVRTERMRTADQTWGPVAAEVLWGQTVIWLSLMNTRQSWIVGWVIVDALLQVTRIVFKVRVARAGDLNRPAPYVPMLMAGFAWLTSFTVGTTFAVRSADPELYTTTAVVATGAMGFAASRYAAFPRIGGVVPYLLAMPVVVGGLAQADMHVFGLLSPGAALAMHALLRHNHAVLMKAMLAEQENLRLSMHDPLTGLPNRLRLREHLSSLTLREGQDPSHYAVLCLDLDGFKPVNDTYGHDAGDRLLRGIADRLRTGVREHDVACRLGGDEFVIVLPGADRDIAGMIAQRVIDLVRGTPLDVGQGHEAVVGVSVGIAVAPDHGRDPELLLIHADNALYAAKRAHKGTYVLYGSSPQTAPVPQPRHERRQADTRPTPDDAGSPPEEALEVPPGHR